MLKLRQTCLGILDDFIVTHLSMFTNMKAAENINFDNVDTIPNDTNYEKVMKNVAVCLESSLGSFGILVGHQLHLCTHTQSYD